MVILPHLVPFLRPNCWLGVGRATVSLFLNTIWVLHGSCRSRETIRLTHSRRVERGIRMMIDFRTGLGSKGLLGGLWNM